MFDFWLVKKLSRQITSWPRSTSRSQRWEPRNPAPPVTKIRLLENTCVVLGDGGSFIYETYNIAEFWRWKPDRINYQNRDDWSFSCTIGEGILDYALVRVA